MREIDKLTDNLARSYRKVAVNKVPFLEAKIIPLGLIANPPEPTSLLVKVKPEIILLPSS